MTCGSSVGTEQRRQALRQHADDGDVGTSRQVEGCRHQGGPRDGHQDAGDALVDAPGTEDDDEAAEADRQGGEVGLPVDDRARQLHGSLDHAPGRDLDTEQGRQLCREDEEGDAQQVPLSDRHGDEVSDEAEACHSHHHEQDADHDRQQRRMLDACLLAEQGKGRQGCQHQRHQR